MFEIIKGLFVCSRKKTKREDKYKPKQQKTDSELDENSKKSASTPENPDNCLKITTAPETPRHTKTEPLAEKPIVSEKHNQVKEMKEVKDDKKGEPAENNPKAKVNDEEIDELIAKLKKLSFDDRISAECSFIEKYFGLETPQNYAINARWLEKYAEFVTKRKSLEPKPCDNTQIAEIINRGEYAADKYHPINQVIWTFLKKMYDASPEVKLKDKQQEPKSTRRIDQKTSSASGRDPSFSESKSTRSVKSKPMGITNEMYFCYLNAVVQALIGIESFTEGLVQKNQAGKVGLYTKALLDLIKEQKNNKDTSAKSLKLLALDTFNHNDQHDAHEFLLHLLSNLQEEATPKKPNKVPSEFADAESAWNFYRKYNNSVIDEIFAGQISSRVTCENCNNVSHSYDPMLDLSLPLNNRNRSLDDCISSYFKQEELPDLYNCEKCKKPTKAVKKFILEKMPRVLVLHLKRFQMYPKKKKIPDFVSFPIDYLSLRKNGESISEQVRYTLKGVVVHIGSANAGHYVALSKRENEWYLCDDDVITRVSAKEIAKKEAYLLFYERVD